MSNYNNKSIKVLEGLEAVRVRPGMYIGSTGSRGLHHLLWEVVDNSIDEALAGHCNTIDVTLYEDGFIEVKDNGRGIPVDKHESGMSTLEVVLTKLHAGGKFDNNNYKFSGGLHGVGISVVNALSTKLIATIYRDGNIYQYTFDKGALSGSPIITKQTGKKITGTSIKFLPDMSIFNDDAVIDVDTIKTRLTELSFLNKGIKINLHNLIDKEDETYYSRGGLKDYIQYISGGDLVTDPVHISYTVEDPDPAEAEIIFAYTDNDKLVTELSFVNNIKTIDGGTHVTGFRTGFTKVINEIARKTGVLKEKSPNFQGKDIREGLIAIVNIKLSNPQFESQTKDKLGSVEAGTLVYNLVNMKLKEILESNSKDLNTIMKKIILMAKIRAAAKAHKELMLSKSGSLDTTLPSKLASCSSRNPKECELFLVEGRLQKLPS